MGEPNAAPRSDLDLDPAKTDANGTSEAHEQDKDDHKPRDSKGWDGKLRVDKLSLSEEPKDPAVEIQSDPEESEDEGPPPEQLPADEDLLDETPEDEEEIELVHMKISDMASLRLERFKQMKVRTSPP
jgi:protein phosphatase 1 regulatory subunit 7